MIDPEPELQKAVIARLNNFAALQALVGARIWDRPPANREPSFPYVTYGETQVLPESNGECYFGSEVNFVLHGWSRQETRAEVKRVGAALREALHGAEDVMVLADHSVVACEFVRSDVFLDEDGRTQRIAVRFRAFTEPTTE